jgi:DNA-binding response OmpR family regulator
MDNTENPCPCRHDDADIRDLRRYLGQNGIKVTVARDAKGCAMLDGTKLTYRVDVMMPGEDGLMLCRAALAIQCAVIMLTARAGSRPDHRHRDGRADDYMGKPFSPRELLARSRASCAGREACRRRSAALRVRFAGWILVRVPGIWSRLTGSSCR